MKKPKLGTDLRNPIHFWSLRCFGSHVMTLRMGSCSRAACRWNMRISRCNLGVETIGCVDILPSPTYYKYFLYSPCYSLMQIPSEWRTLPGRHEAEHESHGVNYPESVKRKGYISYTFFLPLSILDGWVYSLLKLSLIHI